MQNYLWTGLLTLLPIAELRGGIPYAISHDIPPLVAYVYCVALNALIGPFMYFFLNRLHRLFEHWPFYRKIFDKLVKRARHKIQGKVAKYGYWGIALFVGIPLPITGAYTGSLGAWVLGIPPKKTYLAVCVGVAMAGIIVSAIWLSGTQAFSLFIKEVH